MQSRRQGSAWSLDERGLAFLEEARSRALHEETAMADLSNAQREILTTVCERKGGFVLPARSTPKAERSRGCFRPAGRGAIEELPAAAKQEVWRTNDEGVALTLKRTDGAGASHRGVCPLRARG
jgi:hypothetical protein